jgi:hypothetical protein
LRSLYALGDRLFVLYDAEGSMPEGRGLVAYDVSDPANPTELDTLTWSTREWQVNDTGYAQPGLPLAEAVLWSGPRLAWLEHRHECSQSEPEKLIEHTRLRVVDLADANELRDETVSLPKDASYTGLVSSGEWVATSHSPRRTSPEPMRVPFYLDLVDVSEARAPRAQKPIAIPGALLLFDAPSSRALTAQRTRVDAGRVPLERCYERFGLYEFDAGTESFAQNTPVDCIGYPMLLHRVRLDAGKAALEESLELDEDIGVESFSADGGVAFAMVKRGGRKVFLDAGIGVQIGRSFACYECAYDDPPLELVSLGWLERGALELGRITAKDSSMSGWALRGQPFVRARGNSAMVVGRLEVALIDASDPKAPRAAAAEPVYGIEVYSEEEGYRVESRPIDLREGAVILSLGGHGLQRLELDVSAAPLAP